MNYVAHFFLLFVLLRSLVEQRMTLRAKILNIQDFQLICEWRGSDWTSLYQRGNVQNASEKNAIICEIAPRKINS